MKFWSAVLNLFFPPRCAFCRREGDFLCSGCARTLDIRKICHRSLHPSREDFGELDGVIYGLDYAENPAIQASVKQFKYRFTKELVSLFGNLLTAKLHQLRMLSGRKTCLIPVPLHKKRLNERGFNQAELIANEVSRVMGDPVRVRNVLERVRYTPQQARLGKNERAENLKGAFRLAQNSMLPRDAVCFLVDDVCTTGATLDSCAKVLKAAGIPRVYGLVIARSFK